MNLYRMQIHFGFVYWGQRDCQTYMALCQNACLGAIVDTVMQLTCSNVELCFFVCVTDKVGS